MIKFANYNVLSFLPFGYFFNRFHDITLSLVKMCFQVQLDLRVFILSLGRTVTVLFLLANQVSVENCLFNSISFFRSVTNLKCMYSKIRNSRQNAKK